MEKHAWAILPIYQLISGLNQDGELSEFNLIPRQLDQRELDQLGLKSWPSILLKDVRSFFQSISALQLRLQHMTQFEDFPDLDETGTKNIQTYFNNLQDELGKDFQKAVDGAGAIAELFHNMSESSYEKPAFEYLRLATEQLTKIHEKSLPDGMENGEVKLSIESLREWKDQLFSIQEELFIVYLYWCGYVINC